MQNIPAKMKLSLKMARQMRNLKQAEAAKLIGISTDTLSNYERGKSYPDVPILKRIEEVYGIPYNRLIFLHIDYGLTVDETIGEI